VDTALNVTTTLSPLEAFNIDIKMDNGMPNSGVVRAVDGLYLNTALAAGGSTANDCVTGLTPDDGYNVGEQGRDARTCSLRLRFN
jgi:hypothetical protein